MWAVCAIGLRVNGTGFEQVGIYWSISKAPSKGDFVFVLPSSLPIFSVSSVGTIVTVTRLLPEWVPRSEMVSDIIPSVPELLESSAISDENALDG